MDAHQGSGRPPGVSRAISQPVLIAVIGAAAVVIAAALPLVSGWVGGDHEDRPATVKIVNTLDPATGKYFGVQKYASPHKDNPRFPGPAERDSVEVECKVTKGRIPDDK